MEGLDGAPRTQSPVPAAGFLLGFFSQHPLYQKAVALGSHQPAGPQPQTSSTVNRGREAVCPPTPQNKAVRAGSQQPPPCQNPNS